MQMSNEEIVKMYRESKNKKAQVEILADLNACGKEKILSILKEGGVSPTEMPRNRKKTECDERLPRLEERKVEREVLPDIVKEAICKLMEIEQEAIDRHSQRLKELNEYLERR